METAKYKTIVSVLNANDEGFNQYMEMSKRIDLFVQTDGASESEGGMDIEVICQYAVLQDKLYKLALERKKDLSC